jgi:hypothetical protein
MGIAMRIDVPLLKAKLHILLEFLKLHYGTCQQDLTWPTSEAQ